MTPDAEQTRVLGLGGAELTARVEALLAATEGMTPDLKLTLETDSYDGDDLGYGQTEFPWRYAVSTGQGLHIETGLLSPDMTDPDARVIEAAPEMRRLLIALLAENAALAAQVEQLRAQAGAVAGLAEKWAERARDLEKRVPMPMVDDRDAHVLGRSGGLEDCAKDVLALLNAQASAEGEGQERGEGT